MTETDCPGCAALKALDEAIEAYVARARPGTLRLTGEEFGTVMVMLAGRLGSMLEHVGAARGTPEMMEQFELLMAHLLRCAGATGGISIKKVEPPSEGFEVGTKH